jgi:hypothetical protein
MSYIQADAVTSNLLRQAGCVVDLRDDAGNYLGRFFPPERGPEPTISEAEIERRLREGGGRPLADILRDNPSERCSTWTQRGGTLM